jgi:GT2 family glycosyltransferase
MSSQVTAIVVCHDTSDYLKQTFLGLTAQTNPVDRIVVVNTSGQEIESPKGAQVISLPTNTPLAASLRAAIDSTKSSPSEWLWILHDDSAPEPTCLAELLAAEERNSLAALIGPKQVQWSDSRTILQQGLTLSPMGTPISLVSNELDQSQHDGMIDVMAVGTAGLLVRASVFEAIGGLDPKSPPLAADYDLSLRAKLAGHRVIVAPKARIRHAALSLNGQRPRAWLSGSPKTAVRKAALHLRLAYSRIDLALLFWLLLPVITVLRVFWRFLQKRPDRIASELLAGTWAFFTVFARFSSRPKARQRDIRAIRNAFDATWSQVRSINRSRGEHEDAAHIQAAFARGEHELSASAAGKTFGEDRGWLWVFALLASSWAFFPTALASVGGGSVALGQNWWQVFTRAGASWQPIGQGFVAPSDPFNWVLLALASLSPAAPSLSITVLLFLAQALAFVAAYKVATLITPKTWLRTVFGLGYALWPSLIEARSDARIAAVIALVLLPWFVFAVARAAGLGRSGSARSLRQTWSWVGVAGLLMAAIGAASPILLVALLLGLAVVAFTRIRRFGYLLWIPLPVAAIFTPLVWYLSVGLGQPLATLTDPGLPLADRTGSPLELLLGQGWLANAYLLLAAVGLLALLTKRWVLAAVMTLFAAALLALAYLHSSVEYANPVGGASDQWMNGSPSTMLGAFGLVVLALVVLAGEHAPVPLRKVLAVLLSVAAMGPLFWVSATAPRNYDLRDDRVVPWLLSAQAAEQENLQMLVIEPSSDGFAARWQPISGIALEDSNVAYRYSLAALNADNAAYGSLASLVADLVSANGTNLGKPLSESHIAFVLVPPSSSARSNDLANALDSVAELDSAGSTEFGRLWRVNVPVAQAPSASKSPWSITKAVQLSILIAFALLAIPTGASHRRKAKVAAIFIEADGEQA